LVALYPPLINKASAIVRDFDALFVTSELALQLLTYETLETCVTIDPGDLLIVTELNMSGNITHLRQVAIP
jgi:hypothetical protein